VTVLHPDTKVAGTMILSKSETRDMLGNCPASDYYDVDRERIAWRS
jgi:hypothetical protein